MFKAGMERFKQVDPYLSLGGYVLSVFSLLGITVGVVMGWLLSQLTWFWATFQWAGVLFGGVLTWLLIGIGLSLYRREQPSEERRLDPWLVGAGIAALALIICLAGYGLKGNPPAPTAAGDPVATQPTTKKLSTVDYEQRRILLNKFFQLVNGPLRGIFDIAWPLYNDQPRLINNNQKAVFQELMRIRNEFRAVDPKVGALVREAERYPDIRNLDWNYQTTLLGIANELSNRLQVPVETDKPIHVDSKETDELKAGISSFGEWIEKSKEALQSKFAEDDAAEIISGSKASDKRTEIEQIPEAATASAIAAKTHPYDVPKKLAIIDDEIIPIIRDGGEIEIHVWHGQQLLNGWKQSIVTDRPAYMRHLQEYNQNQTGILDRFAKLQKKHSHFEDIASLLDIPNSPYNYMETITKGFVAFKGAIGSIGDPPYTMDLDYFFTPTLQNFSSGLANWDAWRKHIESEFIQLRKQIASGES